MKEGDLGRFYERFEVLGQAQRELERSGYFFLPVPREHAEATVTTPLIHRIRTHITKRSFARVAARMAITFSGYSDDPREIYDIPELRRYWGALDRALPALPALLTVLPLFGYNGPGQHLSLLGTVDEVLAYPTERRYQLHVVEGPALVAQAEARIRQAGRTYHLPAATTAALVRHFRHHAGGGPA